MPKRRYISVAEVAELAGVHEDTVTRWVAKGILKAVRLPGGTPGRGRLRFDEAEVLRTIDQRFPKASA